MTFHSKIRTIEWVNGISRIIDQTVIPYEYKYVDIKTGDEMYTAIKDMIVRGAPAIGIAGAHGVVLYAQELSKGNLSSEEFKSKLIEKSDYLASSRPTAVNLAWAVEQQKALVNKSTSDINDLIKELTDNAVKLELEDIEINKKWVTMVQLSYPKEQPF